MNPILRSFITGVTLVAANTAMADVTFYEADNFNGRQFTVGQMVSNFRDSGFNDRAQSAIVSGGSWEVCVDRDFGGGCTVLAPGRYPNLAGWSGRISSARMVSAGPVAMAPVPMSQGMLPSGGITFYGSDNFGGRTLSGDRAMPSFGAAGFNDRPQSAIVEGGPWEVCVDYNFGGHCTVLNPGRYPTLGAWSGRLSSARPANGQRTEMPRDNRMRGWASATLFSGPNMSGRQFTLGGEGANDLNGAFNDRASSLRVERGYWIFCSDANFRGECMTFGPGEYPNLPQELDNRISSGRRISNEYPYSQRSSSR